MTVDPAADIRKVLRVHSGEEFEAEDFPTLTDGQAAVAALNALVDADHEASVAIEYWSTKAAVLAARLEALEAVAQAARHPSLRLNGSHHQDDAFARLAAALAGLEDETPK